MNDHDLIIRALLSAQRAFLGEISSRMRAAVVSLSDKSIEVRCYFDGPLEPEDLESVSCAETEMMADFEPEISVMARCIRLDAPEVIADDGRSIYARREYSD